MTGAAQPTPGPDATPRRTQGVRFLVVHMLAYAVAFPWAAAAVPVVFAWKEAELLALADERDAVILVLRWAALPALVAFVVPHVLGIPWIRAAGPGSPRGRLLFAAGSAVLTALGVAAAIAAWIVVVGR